MDGLPPRAPPSVARYGPVPAATPYHRGGLEVGSSGGGNGGVSPPPPQGVALAYHEVHKQQAQRKSTAWKVWLVLGDCTLIGLSPVLVHMAKDSQGHYAFSPISVNLLVELAKTLFALGTLIAYGTGRPGLPMYRSWRSFLRDARHNHLLLIPAGLYAVNNYLKFLMQLYFRPTTAKMLSNLKILVIAVLMKGVLGRTFSLFQWEALYLLVAGITVNQLNYCGQEGGGDIFSTASLLYTLGSITVPSLASVYNEFALKKHMDTSVLLQNFFLYFFGMCFNLIGLLLMMATGHMAPSHVLTGFRAVTVVLVVNNALQGILSSFFYKYADTILKKYSSTIATIFTGLASAALFGHPLTLNFLIGVSIVFISMHLFFSMGSLKGAAVPPGKDHGGATSTKLAVSPSMDHLLSLSTAASRTQSTLSMASLAGGSGSGSGAAAGAEADGLATLLGPKAAARAPAVLPR